MQRILLLIVCVISFSGWSQSGDWWKRSNNNEENKQDTTAQQEVKSDTVIFRKGEVKISKDPRIDKLIEFKSAKIPPATAPKKDGFRVQLFFDQDRKKVDEARSKMLQIHADADTYIEYKAPNYNLLLGNYRTRLAAEKVRAELLGDFPEAIIVKDQIYFPEIEED